jgi:predicted adenine nucleotide alpha hydrolase (AANH) superfamily ATPase
LSRERLLLHTCCAPCIGYVYELLSPEYDVTAFYYNPNIHPRREYAKRRDELAGYADRRGFPMIEAEPDMREWTREVSPYRFMGEKSIRCQRCYELRLGRTFREARRLGFDRVSTALSISPHKDAEAINRIGRELSKKFSIPFLEADFKKQDGFKKSVEISRECGFYRQNYCGCVYSRLEREKNEKWLERSRRWRDEKAGFRGSQ